MTPNQIAQAAEKIAKARLENKTIELLTGKLCPQDYKTAVAIQDELVRLIGHKVVGWKVGGRLKGQPPVWACFSTKSSEKSCRAA